MEGPFLSPICAVLANWPRDVDLASCSDGLQLPMDTRDHVVPSVRRRPGVVAVFLAAGGWLAADSAHAWSSAALRRRGGAGARDRRAARLGAPDLRWHRPAQPGAHRSLALRRGPGAVGVESVWRKTGDRRYLDYIKSNVDPLVGPGGGIKGYEPGAYILDDMNMGKVLFALHAEAKDAADKERYRRALVALRAQLTRAAAHGRRRLLAQADLPAPDVGRRRVHGVAVSREVRGRVRRAGRARRGGQAGPARGDAPARREDRPALPRLGRGEDGALGRTGRPGCRRSSGDAAMGWYAMAVADVLAEMPRRPSQARRRSWRCCGVSRARWPRFRTG